MEDIIYEIFKLLDLQDSYHYALACQQNYQVFNKEMLWKFYLLIYDDQIKMLWKTNILNNKLLELIEHKLDKDIYKPPLWANGYKLTYQRYYGLMVLKQYFNFPFSPAYIFNDLYFKMDRQQLTKIPKAIGVLTNVKKLFLHCNFLTSVPGEIGNLTNLIELSLDSNQLTVIPKEISQLTKLESLWLNNNQLASVPNELCNLIHLQTLCLHNNKLTTLPNELGNLINLTWMHVESNLLTDIPESLKKLPNLELII